MHSSLGYLLLYQDPRRPPTKTSLPKLSLGRFAAHRPGLGVPVLGIILLVPRARLPMSHPRSGGDIFLVGSTYILYLTLTKTSPPVLTLSTQHYQHNTINTPPMQNLTHLYCYIIFNTHDITSNTHHISIIMVLRPSIHTPPPHIGIYRVWVTVSGPPVQSP